MAASYTTSILMAQTPEGWLVESTTSGLDYKYRTSLVESLDSLATLRLRSARMMDSTLVRAILSKLSPATLHSYQAIPRLLLRSVDHETFIAITQPHFLVALMNLSMMIPPARLKISRSEICPSALTTALTITWVQM